ncbi:MAG: protein kinase [Planctomycetota bacterium]
MDSDRRQETDPEWAEVREYYLDLDEMEAPERSAALRELKARRPEIAAQVESLLEIAPDDDLDGSATEGPGRQATRIGPYEILRSAGRGGMGEVYVARRADGAYEHEVAIKLMRAGWLSEEMRRRFQRERQTLARLDHPYIARLLDGGSTEQGQPFLVMEYVDGEPADTYAARVSLEERLELFLRIAEAVQHAHDQGYVHRDLKPNNILVRSDGTPRLLDFGIAGVLEGQHPKVDAEEGAGARPLTRTGSRLFTPDYASPEQVRGEAVDERSDLFALGVLLYRFLCGRSPWVVANEGVYELEQAICHQEPRPPSRNSETSGTRISGDLDAITLQCLAKRPLHRYQSVQALRQDVENYIHARPISVRRVGGVERWLRKVRRRPWLALAGALFLISGVLLWSTWSSTSERLRRERDLSQAMDGQIDAIDALIADGKYQEANAELDRLSEDLTGLESLPDAASQQAWVLVHRAAIALNQVRLEEALEALDRAAEWIEDLSPDPETGALSPRDIELVATSYNVRADVEQMFDTRRPEAIAASRRARDFALQHLAPGHPQRIGSLLGWSRMMGKEGKREERLAAAQQAVEEAGIVDPRDENQVYALWEQSRALVALSRLEEAVDSYRAAVEVLVWNRGGRHPTFAMLRHDMASALFRLERFDEAQEEYARAAELSRSYELDDFLASSLHFLARLHVQRQEWEEAEECALESIDVHERLASDLGHMQRQHTRSTCLLGTVYAATGRCELAGEILGPLLAGSTKGILSAEVDAEARYRFGVCLHASGESDAATPLLQAALQFWEPRLDSGDARLVEIRQRLESD